MRIQDQHICSRIGKLLLTLLFVSWTPGMATAAEKNRSAAEGSRSQLLTPSQWQDLDSSVDRGLEYLSQHQRTDGSFESPPLGQPAVTCFCVMAYLSRGHVPDQGPYGKQLSRAIKYVLSKQQPNGLFCDLPPGTNDWKLYGAYHHPIAGLMLSEVYGMTQTSQHEEIRRAIIQALAFTRQRQTAYQRRPEERGGWRYLSRGGVDADLSATAWQLMFLRSAKNAEFDIPLQHIEEAVAFVKRCYVPQRGSFSYGLNGYTRTSFSRSMAGAGILSLALAGEHQTQMARKTAGFILAHPFDRFNRGGLTAEDRYYYGAYYCSQAMFQLGGEDWQKFNPGLERTFVNHQSRDGSWEREANQDGPLGLCYSTSFAILTLTPPYQLLPIYQR